MLAAAQDWIKEHKERGVQPVFANPSRQVVRLMRAAGLHDLIGEEFITVRMNDAVLLCQVRALPPWLGSCGGAATCGLELHVCLHKAVKLGDAQLAGVRVGSLRGKRTKHNRAGVCVGRTLRALPVCPCSGAARRERRRKGREGHLQR